MPNLFVLNVETQPNESQAIFRLSDAQGVHLAAHQVSVTGKNAFQWAGLFNTREHVSRYAGHLRSDNEPLTAENLLAQLGEFLGSEVLGKDIITQLYKGIHQRTLLIRLPDTRDDGLAAALARVPWEIARPAVDKEPLLARPLALRAITAADLPDDKEIPLKLADGEVLRVLLIFVESPDSRPLAARLERERLLALFYDDILPQHLVQIDVLCYGVTRAVIEDQVIAARGYHIVHWSGHGHHDTLELLGEDGKLDKLHGEELVDLFAKAGGFIPSLVFLNACHSGTVISAADWEHWRDALKSQQKSDEKWTPKDISIGDKELAQMISDRKGYTGTALALLHAGVPQVVAMRYAVDDAYARRLARRFYRHFLAEQHPADKALALARSRLANDPRIGAIDHTTPLLFGRDRLSMRAHNKRNSAQLKKRYPRPSQPLLQHDLKRPDHFVGRGKELTRLNREWLPRHKPAVALLQGLAGLGKTALAAETLHLWHNRFDWVFVVQARPHPLTAETFYQEIDQRLTVASKDYRATCKEDEYRKLWLPKDKITGAERYQIMRDNLINALYDEHVLLIIDNFDTNLLPDSQGYICQDPEWQNLLEDFCSRLSDRGSRVLITSRHRPAVLKDRAVWLPLGPLPLNEANLFLQSHKDLNNLWHDKATSDIAMQVLKISRGHPLIMQRLGNLAKDVEGLAAALNRLETKGYEQLPDLVIGANTDEEREKERGYLEEVAIGAVDVLIERLTPDARQLLWVVTLALEPVSYPVLVAVWEGTAATVPSIGQLTESGLLQQEGEFEESVFSFHELVRERCTVWMDQHPQDRGECEAKQIRQIYGEQYVNLFWEWLKSRKPNARETATEMGLRALTYLVRAGAFEALSHFASHLVTGTENPQQLGFMIAELQTIVKQVPIGKMRWTVRSSLAVALKRSGQPEKALPLYEQSVKEAEAAQDWSEVGRICHNWANALRNVGKLSQAYEIFQRAAQAYCKANSFKIYIIGGELEMQRIDIYQDKAQQTLPKIEEQLAQLRAWWQSYQQGETVAATPDLETLKRVLITALDTAREAHLALEHWQICLDLISESEKVEQAYGDDEHAMIITRFNRYYPLMKLGKLEEAQQVLKDCLQVDSDVGDIAGQSADISALAEVWYEQGDVSHAIKLERQALAMHERLTNPTDRALSHGDLSNYLFKDGQIEQAGNHKVAAMVYLKVTGNLQKLAEQLRDLTNERHQAAQTATPYPLPRLNDLLKHSEFSVLRRFLEEWEINLDKLQEKIDALVKPVEADIKPVDKKKTDQYGQLSLFE